MKSHDQQLALDILTQLEQVQQWNATEVEYPQHLCVHQLFEQQVEREPNATAVVFEGQSLAYGELNSQGNQLAYRLLALGVKPDDRVAICVERGLEMVVGLLGILKAGAGYVPLDPAYPDERLAYMLADSEPVALLTQRALAERFSKIAIDVPLPSLMLDELEASGVADATGSTDNPILPDLTPSHLAYVIYTSGSTGQPKGVANPHRGVVNRLDWMQRAYHLTPLDRVLQKTPFSFDVSVWEFFWPLHTGATLVVAAPGIHKDPQALVDLIRAKRISVLHFVPSMLSLFLQAEGVEGCDTLRHVVCSGEALSAESVKWLRKRLPTARLSNLYGPTEAAVDVTAWECPKDFNGDLVPIGRPISNIRIHILDKAQQAVPIGSIGEIYIGGAGVARGYLNRPELTAERFLPDPFSQQPGARLYKTGDLGRYLPDGNIEFLGRNDDQVKIRGFRIELKEIELALRTHPSVRESVVLAKSDRHEELRLIAYLIGSGQTASVEDLRSHLAKRLPEYMLPTAYVELKEWPLTSNGKLDRRALPEPDTDAYVSREYEAPQGEIEQQLAAIWQDLLGVERVGRYDHFFELGGHSLMAVRLLVRLRKQGLSADFQAFFAQPTLAVFAATIGHSEAVEVPPNRIPLGCTEITPEMLPLATLSAEEIKRVIATVPGGVENVQDIYALAPLQEGFLYHHMANQQGDLYLLYGLFGVKSRSHLDRLCNAFQQVIDRHDILRSAVVWQGLSEPVQVVWRQATLPTEEVVLDPTPGRLDQQLLAHFQFDPRRDRLDLEQAPLMRLSYAYDPVHARWLVQWLCHHLVMDHVAMEVLFEELALHLQNGSATLPASVPYRNYIAQARLGVSPEQHEAFFSRMLSDVVEPTLPYGLTDVRGDGQGICEVRQSLDADFSKRLRTQARQMGVTPASLHHLAWARVVGALSGRDDVVFGTVLLGRMQGVAGTERAMGMHINTLPVRLSVGTQPVGEAVHETHAQLMALIKHEHASLALAQRCSGVQAPMPLFSALLNYRHDTPLETSQAAWDGIEILAMEERTNCPLTLSVDDLGKGFDLVVQAVEEINAERVCGYMQEALVSLVTALEQTPDQAVHHLSLLPTEELAQLKQWNATEVEYPQHFCLHQLFEQQVKREPNATAVIFEDRSLTYGELNRKANQLAHRLLALGMQPDDRVAICMERSLEMVVGLLGILKAGVGYVPLDPAYPDERLAYMLADSEPVVLLTQRTLAERLGRMGMDNVPSLMLDELEAEGIALQPSNNPILPTLTSSHLAYVIYTSGSAGKPKGVANPHRGVVNRLDWMQRAYHLTPQDRVLQKTTFSFDVSVWEFFWPLHTGATLVMAAPGIHKDPQALVDLIRAERISVLHFVPSMLSLFLQAEGVEGCDTLRHVVCSGEPLPAESVKRLREQLPTARLSNLYGPTEAAIDVTAWECPKDFNGDLVPIGRPISNIRIHILDGAQQAVPIGSIGEIYIGGAGVARGYLNRPELTAERFLPDPFSQQLGSRLYKTGDLGRYLPDGNIEFLGRNDDQVKIRGFRIELKEIALALRTHPSVRESVVLAKSDRHEELRLIAYLIGSGEAASTEELRSHLAKRLPEYMLPAAYVVLEEWPLTTSGKLDRRALPEPDTDAYVSRVYEAPQGEVEQQMASIWQDLLGVERVGHHDHFFELGGHSLMSIRLLARLREQGLAADLQALFAQPTLAAFAATIGHSEAVKIPANLIPLGCTEVTPEMLPLATLSAEEIQRVIATVPGGVENVQDIYALAPLQEGILYHHVASQQGDLYLLYGLFGVKSRVHLDRLCNAFQQAIDRHDILRSAVVWQGLSEPVQVVWRQARLSTEEVVLDPMAGRPEQQLLAHFNPHHDRLDPEQAPLMRLSYAYDSAHGRWLVQWVCHHLVMDHVAIEALFKELTLHLQGGSATLPESVPYRNYIAQARLGVSPEQHEAFFSRMLFDVVEPTLPYGLADVRGDGQNIREVRQSLETDLSRRLRTQARQLGVTPASLHHLAWAHVVGALSGRDDVVFGTVLFGRMQGGAEIEQAMGMYINTLPARLSVGAQPVREAVRETHARLMALIKHEHASLALAQRCSGVQAPMPLFSTLLNYRHDTPLETSQAAWDGIDILSMEERTNYPLTLSVDDFGEEFRLVVQAVEEINAKRVCGYMREALVSLVTALEQTPNQAVHHLSVLPAEELAQLAQWNATEAEYPQHLCLHQLFEQQVERNPNATAVVFEGCSLTYGELNHQANQLAHRLLALGVQPDDRVAICVERSLEMIIGLLGILKAGAGYVPLDPAYPDERLAYMLADSEPVVLLTQRTLAERLGRMGMDNVPSLMLDELEAEGIALQPSNNPILPTLTSSHLAYVIYTSGSTGQPKGVMVEHRSVLNLLGITSPWFELEPHDVYALFSSLAFDASVEAIWGTLLHGAQLMIVPYSTILSPQECYRLICDAGVTVFLLTSGVFRQLIEAQTTSPHQHQIRQVFLGGDAADPSLLKGWYEQPKNAQTQLINKYGPTEATVYATFYRTKIADQTAACVPIGRPIGNTQIHILDKAQQAVPIGAVGEIYIGGAGVARGYLNRPELTAERFLPDPFSQQLGSRLYKTGDLGRYLPDGNIEYLGRNDDQVKIRGFRIELKEIESALRTHPLVREAVVLAKSDRHGESRLIAYLIGSGEAVAAQELRSHLAKRLPEYMLPAAYVELKEWPLTSNGKLDPRALPEPEADAYVSRVYEAPQGKVERQLALIWQDLLGVERVGRHDHFFELGGHSLMSVRLLARLREQGLSADLQALFAEPTLMAFATTIGHSEAVEVPPNLIPLGCIEITPEMLPLATLSAAEIEQVIATVPGGVGNVQDIYALAPLQEGILYHHVSNQQGDPYLIYELFEVKSRVHLDCLCNALQQVINRHDVLRSAVVWQGLSEPVQVVWRQATLPTEEVVLDIAAGRPEQQMLAHFNPRRDRLDLEQAPLMRFFYAQDLANQRWVAMLCYHHLIGDGASLQLFFSELLACLHGHRLPASLPYRNYIAQARLGVSREQHEVFFQQMLSDVEEPTLPYGLNDVRGDGREICEVRQPLETDLSRRLRTQARQLGVTSASLYHLAWARVIGALSGRNDVVFGTVLLGRMQGAAGIEQAMGMYINTLPVRLSVGTQPVSEAVRETHAQLMALIKHEHAPLALAQRCSGVPAPLPLFSSLLNYRHITSMETELDIDPLASAGIEILSVEGRTNYPLTLSVDDLGEGFNLVVQAVEEINAERVCGYMREALVSLVTALEQTPNQAVHHLSVLPTEELAQLKQWNATEAEYPQHLCIHQLFEQQVKREPNATAVIFEDRSLTYGELNRKANQLAHRLLALGMQPDDRVAICMERSLEMVVGLLGILKAGVGYVPLDPAYPDERLAYMLADSEPVVLLTQRTLAERLGRMGMDNVPSLMLDELEAEGIALQPSNNPILPTLTSSHLAYVIYTSGSTGQPKGVMVEHRSVLNLLGITSPWFELEPHDVYALFSSLAFDASVEAIWGTLLHGAQLMIVPYSTILSPQECYRLICDAGVTVFLLTSGVFRQLIEAQTTSPHQHQIRQVFLGGDAADPSLLKGWYEQPKNAQTQLINKYGPTEATVYATFYRTKIADQTAACVPIGRPIGNTQIHILDKAQQAVPIGAVGEIYIGGAGVARGYLNRPELTAERFLPDPFSQQLGSRLYKTGDLGRYLPDGNIEYLGRNDDQVKIRGFRIELKEIESALRTHPLVREAVVLAKSDRHGESRLIAYLIGSGEAVAAQELRSHLAKRLPEYMLPAAYVELKEWPLTSNGKLDPRALPEPEADAYVSRVYEAPQGKVERQLALIWQDLLGVERVGRHDHFFELGGHSLMSVRLLARLREQGLSADLQALFAEPTLMAFATTIGHSEAVEVPPNLIPLGCIEITPEMLPLATLSAAEIEQVIATVPGGVGNVQDIYALAPLQEGILYHHVSNQQGDPYLIYELFEVKSRVHLDCLCNALQQVINRHDVLRSAVVWQGLSEPVQVVWHQATLPTEEVVLDIAAGRPEQQMLAHFNPRRDRLDLEQAPLMRFFYAQDLANQRWVAMLCYHHLIGDGISLQLFFSELLACLHGHRLPASLPYRNYIAQARLGVSREQHEVFFQQMLSDVEEPTLPYGLSDVRGDGRGIREVRQPLETDLSRRLRTQARQLGVTSASLYHLAWARVIGALSGRNDVVFGTVLLGRMQGAAGIEQAMGMYINTLPVRLSVGTQPVSEAVRETHAQLMALIKHEHAPLALAQRCSGVPAPLPLFSSLLNYRHITSMETELDIDPLASAGIEILSVEGRTNYPLTLAVDDLGKGFDLVVQAVEEINAERVCGYMREALVSLVTALEQTPNQAVHHLSVLPTEELAQLKQWNATEAEYPQHLCIHQLFEQQVKREPNATAVIFEDRSLTYGELNRKANQLAHRLLALGMQPDDRVAICMERSLEMVVGLLGVLKAGAAYVPLDPAYPDERLAYMLADSEPMALLTQRVLAERLSKMAMDMPALMLDESEATDSADNPILPALTPSHLAYVIYTSGSTGQPKGVMVEHRSVLNLLGAISPWFDLNSHDIYALFLSFAFDNSGRVIWGTLLHGAKLLILPYSTVLSPQESYRLVCEAGVTVLTFTASVLRQLIEAQTISPHQHRIRQVVLGGEVVDPSLLKGWYGQPENAQTQLFNEYGPTEATVYATIYRTKIADQTAVRVPIGRPNGNVQIHILDEAQQAVPIGAIGEIYIGGAGVARGYLNRPELTAERFLPDPFSQQPGARIYKTGDLGRYLPDGNIEFHGRNDDQVKIRGFRIELKEIEVALKTHPLVREAVVLAKSDRHGEPRLIAYLIDRAQDRGSLELWSQELQAGTKRLPKLTQFLGSGESVSAKELRSYLAKRLPEYMLPAAYVELEEWPLTSNGKLDRRTLPEPDADAYASRVYEAPQGEVEQQLALIWQDLLGVERVGRHDHFFELGGHSLMSVRLLARLREQGLSADLQALFAEPTLAAFAATIGHSEVVEVPANRIPWGCTEITPEMLPLATLSAAEIEQVIATVPGGVGNVQDIYALAPLQEGILYHYMASQQGDPYLQHILYSLQSKADLDAMLAALQQVINRHDVLRSAVIWQGLSEPVQVVWRQATLPTEEVVLDIAAGRPEQQMLAHFNPRRDRLDLEQAPLMRFFYAQDLANQRWVAMLCYHHLIGDGISLQLFFSELLACLHGHRLPASLPYRNYIAQARLGVSREQHEVFFQQMLSDVEEPTLPYGLSDVRGDGRGIREVRQPLETDLSRRLRTQARQLGVTSASLYHLAWARVIGALSGRNDVVFGTVLLGRMQGAAGIEQAMGMYINTLPVRLSVGTQPVSEAVRETHAQLMALIKHEHAPLALAQRCSGVPAPLPLFSSLLNYRHITSMETELDIDPLASAGIEILSVEGRTNYPLTLAVDDLGKGFDLVVQAVEEINAERVCGYMREALVSLVTALEQTPNQAVHHLSVLPTEELAQLKQWNATEAEYPQHLCIHQLFEQQVKRKPNATAVIFEDRSLTYGELNRKANQLAHRLLALGVQPDDRVAICMDRSLEMIVGLLGVLKAGAAYVPLDPAYPDEWLTYMLADSGPVVLLTQRALAERLSKMAMDVPALMLDESEATGSADNPILSALTPSHLAYVIYTSGSTGQPKGVMVEHRSVLNLLGTTSPWVKLQSHNVHALFLSFAFDASVKVIWGTLVHGAQLLVMPYSTILSPQECYQLICDAGVTGFALTPGVFRQLIEAHATSPQKHQIRQVILGGDVIDPLLLEGWYGQAENTQTQLINEYGPTEATICATFYRIKIADQTVGRVPIGRPIGNVQIHILDEAQQAVPIGAIGEIYIGGAGVARGYLNRPELTEERFLPDPFSQQPGARLYKTGDLGRYLPDGNIEFLGRNDDQVKIRGFRIELKEIELALKTHPLVREAVVLAKADQQGELRLIAYLIPNGEEASAKELRNQLAKRLPEYMLPAAYVELEQWPLTTNGKLDRRALPEPMYEKQVSSASRTPHEHLLCELFAEVLDIPHIGIDNNFFELGGNSLSAMRLINKINSAFGLHLSIHSIFEAPNVRELAPRLMEDNCVGSAFETILPLRKRGKLPPLFCIHPVYGLSWCYSGLIHSLHRERPLYGIQARGFPEPEATVQDMAGLARDYVRAMRMVQPQGPYLLLGWSFGGLVAHEMACQLQAADAEVELLALMDSYPILPDILASDSDEQEPHLLREYAEELNIALSPEEVTDLNMTTFVKAARRANHILGCLDEKETQRFIEVRKNFSRLIPTFQPGVVAGDILFFQAMCFKPYYLAHGMLPPNGTLSQAWQPYVDGKIQVYPMNCTHNEMANPTPIREIGRKLELYLHNKVQLF